MRATLLLKRHDADDETIDQNKLQTLDHLPKTIFTSTVF